MKIQLFFFSISTNIHIISIEAKHLKRIDSLFKRQFDISRDSRREIVYFALYSKSSIALRSFQYM